ncbi:MAG: GAF domain-containing protein [Paracoccaceae bacterium]
MSAAARLHQETARLGTILFTVTVLDPERALVWRSYTSHPVEYPLQGSKPQPRDDWFIHCVEGRQTFVANTPAEFEQHFFDHALITSMGLGSAASFPLADDAGVVRLTVNLLAGPGHFTPQRLAAYGEMIEAARPDILAEAG